MPAQTISHAATAIPRVVCGSRPFIYFDCRGPRQARHREFVLTPAGLPHVLRSGASVDDPARPPYARLLRWPDGLYRTTPDETRRLVQEETAMRMERLEAVVLEWLVAAEYGLGL
jgi:hypothetical protein